jgi:hypothetical protein
MEWLLLAATHTGNFSNIFRNFVRLLRMSDQPVAKASTYTWQRTQKDEDKHPFLERNSNPRSQRPSDECLRLRPVIIHITVLKFNSLHGPVLLDKMYSLIWSVIYLLSFNPDVHIRVHKSPLQIIPNLNSDESSPHRHLITLSSILMLSSIYV